MNYRDDEPATRADLKFLAWRLGYWLTVLGAVLVYGLVVLFLALKW
jgi:uncharacterized membrane protein